MAEETAVGGGEAEKPKSKKEWWDYGDVKRKPPAKAAKEMVRAAAGAKKGEAPKKGEASDEMKLQAMIILMKPLSGLRHAMRTHPKKILDNEKALEALKTMATDFEWAEGYGGEKYAKVVEAAQKLWNGDASGLTDLTQAGYNYDELAAKYGQLFGGKGGPAEGQAPAEESKKDGLDDAINSIFE